jgi:hypothetical protein
VTSGSAKDGEDIRQQPTSFQVISKSVKAGKALKGLRQANPLRGQIELRWVPSVDRSNKTALPVTGPGCIQVVYE